MIFRAHSAANPLRRTRTRTDDVFNVYMYVFLMLSKKHIDVKKIKVNVSMIELRSTLMISADLINARSLNGRSTAIIAELLMPTFESCWCVGTVE